MPRLFFYSWREWDVNASETEAIMFSRDAGGGADIPLLRFADKQTRMAHGFGSVDPFGSGAYGCNMAPAFGPVAGSL